MQIIGAILAVFTVLSLAVGNLLVAALFAGFCSVFFGVDAATDKLLRQLKAMEQALIATAHNTAKAAHSPTGAEVTRH